MQINHVIYKDILFIQTIMSIYVIFVVYTYAYHIFVLADFGAMCILYVSNGNSFHLGAEIREITYTLINTVHDHLNQTLWVW